MGRPTKQGIDYFPLDVNFDDKVEMLLIEKEAKGLAVLVALWQIIYANEGYYIKNSQDLHLLIKRKINVPVSEVAEIIDACIRREIFDKELYNRFGILTSKAIQKRYFFIARNRKAILYHPEYLLISPSNYTNLVSHDGNPKNEATKNNENEVEKNEESNENHFQKDVKNPLNEFLTQKNGFLTQKNGFPTSETPQSKVKESKVKKRKEKESKEKEKKPRERAETSSTSFSKTSFSTSVSETSPLQDADVKRITDFFRKYTRIRNPDERRHIAPLMEILAQIPEKLTKNDVWGCIAEELGKLTPEKGVKMDFLTINIRRCVARKHESVLEKEKQSVLREAREDRLEENKLQAKAHKQKRLLEIRRFYEKNKQKLTPKERYEFANAIERESYFEAESLLALVSKKFLTGT